MEVRVLPPQPSVGTGEGRKDIVMPGKKNLTLVERTEFGSRVSRRLRRSGSIPTVVYGRGGEEICAAVDEKQFMDVIGYSTSTGIINLVAEGKAPITAIVKDVQWDILSDRPLHLDFLRVSPDQIVSVPVHVHLESTPRGVLVGGGVLEHILHSLVVRVRARDIPSVIRVDVADLDIGDSIHISEIDLPEGISVDMDHSLVIATVVAPTVTKAMLEEEAEEELEEGVVPEEGAPEADLPEEEPEE